jgi:allantoate deiminase
MERCDELAAHSIEEGKITRPYGTAALNAAREQIDAWMRDAGMATHIDAIGNLIGRYEADDTVTEPKTFILGGHFDSVRDAGRYDGTLGVLTAIAAVERLHAAKTRFPFTIEVIAFAEEEGLRFLTTFLTSSPLAGKWDPAWLMIEAADGVTLEEAIRHAGGDPAAIPGLARSPESLLGFIEVHIEQGPVLQEHELPVAVVSGITGSARAEITFTGMAGHAGTVPMTLRRDALAAAAELVLEVERFGMSEEGLVATVGQLVVEPGASNVIPGRTKLTLDLRHPDPGVRERAVRVLQEAAHAIAARRSVELSWTDTGGFRETPSDEGLNQLLRNAIAEQGIEVLDVFSGAGHDAVSMVEITPVTMLFVRCKDGISHNPLESITTEDVAVALRVLDGFIDRLPTAPLTSGRSS